MGSVRARGGGDRGRSAVERDSEVEGKGRKRGRRHNTPQEPSTASVSGRPPRLPQRQLQHQSEVTTVPKPGARTVPGRRVGSAATAVAGVAGFKIPRKKIDEGKTGEERAKHIDGAAKAI